MLYQRVVFSVIQPASQQLQGSFLEELGVGPAEKADILYRFFRPENIMECPVNSLVGGVLRPQQRPVDVEKEQRLFQFPHSSSTHISVRLRYFSSQSIP